MFRENRSISENAGAALNAARRHVAAALALVEESENRASSWSDDVSGRMRKAAAGVLTQIGSLRKKSGQRAMSHPYVPIGLAVVTGVVAARMLWRRRARVASRQADTTD